MKLILDSFWRAVAYSFLPQILGLSLLPLLLSAGLVFGLAWLFWDPTVAVIRATIENWSLVEPLLKWIESTLGHQFRVMLVPLIIVALAVPIVVVLSLLLVSWIMTPAIIRLVHRRRFPDLLSKQQLGMWRSVLWSLGCSLIAVIALTMSAPLFLIPPLVIIIPPLIWGWLSMQVMTFDILSPYATTEEKQQLIKEHRWPLLLIGVISGYLSAAPSVIWVASAMTIALAPIVICITIWLYTLVFSFSAAWFTHYILAVLKKQRQVADVMISNPIENSEGLAQSTFNTAQQP